MTLKDQYQNKHPLATMATSAFGGMMLMAADILNDRVLVCDVYEGELFAFRWHNVRVNSKGNYFVRYRRRYYLSDFLRMGV